jgi:hypothetical protein
MDRATRKWTEPEEDSGSLDEDRHTLVRLSDKPNATMFTRTPARYR